MAKREMLLEMIRVYKKNLMKELYKKDRIRDTSYKISSEGYERME